MMNNNGNGGSNGSRPGWWLPFRREKADMDLTPYRRLALQLHYEMPRGQARRIVLVTTAKHSVMTAQAGAALARCLADEIQKPVLLVDAAPRRADLSASLGCGGELGLANLLGDPLLSLSDLTRQTTHPGVSFLPAGTTPSGHPVPLENLASLLEKAERSTDFVVLAGSSILEESVGLALAPLVGRVLLLAVENETMLTDLEAAKASLRYCRADRVALVLTTPVASRQWAST